MPTEHECPLCHKKFNLKNSLAKHLRATHDTKLSEVMPKEPTNECPVCFVKFKTRDTLGKHLKRIHNTSILGIKKMGGAAEGIKCPECDRTFKNNFELGKHRRFRHGVLGRAAAKRQAMAIQKPEIQVPTKEIKERHSTHEATEAGQNVIDTLAYAIAIGQTKEFCRNFAEEHGIPTKLFTRQFAELFLREARR